MTVMTARNLAQAEFVELGKSADNFGSIRFERYATEAKI